MFEARCLPWLVQRMTLDRILFLVECGGSVRWIRPGKVVPYDAKERRKEGRIAQSERIRHGDLYRAAVVKRGSA